jgi:hypothetical protein
MEFLLIPMKVGLDFQEWLTFERKPFSEVSRFWAKQLSLEKWLTLKSKPLKTGAIKTQTPRNGRKKNGQKLAVGKPKCDF